MKFIRWVMDVCPFRLPYGRIESWLVSTEYQILILLAEPLARTDSAMASSSEDRNFFEPLFCFLAAWLFLGVGEFLKGRAPRCWLKKVAVADADWVCAGDCGAVGADALEEEAAEGGF